MKSTSDLRDGWPIANCLIFVFGLAGRKQRVNAETGRSGAATETGQYLPLPLSPPPPRIPPAERRKSRRKRRRKMCVCKRNLAQIGSFSKIALRRNAEKRRGGKIMEGKIIGQKAFYLDLL